MVQLKKFVRALFTGVFLLALVAAAVVGFTQTQVFRSYLRSFLLTQLGDLPHGSLYLGEFHGSLFTGLTIDGVALKVDGTYLAAAEKLELRYDPFVLVEHRIAFGKVILYEPRIRLVRYADSTWNFERLSTEEEKPKAKRFDWTIVLRDLEIRSGVLAVVDSTALPADTSKEYLHYTNLTARDLNLLLEGEIGPDHLRARVENLALSIDTPAVAVRRIAASILIAPQGIAIDSLRFDLDQTHLTANARLEGIDLLGGEVTLASLRSKRVHLSCDAQPISARELRTFLGSLRFMDGAATIRGRIEGTFGSMAVQELTLKTGESEISLHGRLDNVHSPADLYLNVETSRAHLVYRDVMDLLAGLPIPDFSSLGETDALLRFVGRPLNFTASVALSSLFGHAEAEAKFDLTRGPMQYDGKISLRDMNFAFLQDGMSPSKLSGSAAINGTGTRLDQMNAHAELRIDTSSYGRFSIRNLSARVDASQGFFQIAAQGATDAGTADFVSTLDATRTAADSVPSYTIDGSLSSVNLADLLRDPFYNSSLNFGLHVVGSGTGLEDFLGMVSVRLAGSTVRSKPIDDIPVDLNVAGGPQGGRHITFRSPVADATFKGKFSYGGLIEAVNRLASRLAGEVAARTGAGSRVNMTVPTFPDSGRDSVRYSVDIRDISPIARFFTEDEMAGSGTLTGSIDRRGPHVDFEDTLFIDYFARLLAEGGLYVRGGRLSFGAHDDALGADLDSMVLALEANADRLVAGKREISTPTLALALSGRRGTVSGSAMVDSVLNCRAAARIDARDSIVTLVDVDTLEAAYRLYRWYLAHDVNVTLAPRSLAAHAIDVDGPSGRIHLASAAVTGDSVAGELSADRLRLDSLVAMVVDTSQHVSLDGMLSVGARLTGTLSAPEVSANLQLDSVTYGRVRVGDLKGDALLASGRVSGSLALRGSKASVAPPLVLGGSFPLSNENDTLALNLGAESFPLAILAPLVSVGQDFGGTLTGSLRVTGTAKAPVFSGGLSARAGMVFLPNNIPYDITLSAVTSGSKWLIDSIVVRNDQADNPDGKLLVRGEVLMDGFNMGSFDAAAIGQLLIMKEPEHASPYEMHGTLSIGTGPDSVCVSGTSQHAMVRGLVRVRQGSIVFPASVQFGEGSTESGTNYVFVDSTAAPKVESQQARLERLIGERRRQAKQEAEAPSFVDQLSTDLTLETFGKTEIRYVINPLTDEELFAVLNGKLHLVRSGRDIRLAGDIGIGEHSYYNFYKRFSAGGKLMFTGDPVNPELDITATYTGMHTRALSDSVDRVVVTLHITGTKDHPDVAMSMTENDKPRTGTDVQSDVVSFLIFGRYKDEVLGPERGPYNPDIGTALSRSIISGFASSLFSAALTNFARETGFIQSAELSYGGGGMSSAGLRLSGEIQGAYWRYEGKVFNDVTNADIVVQFSVGDMLREDRLRSLILEFARRSRQANEFQEEKQNMYEGRLFYRITF